MIDHDKGGPVMSKHDPASNLSVGQFGDLVGELVKQFPRCFHPGLAQHWVQRKNSLRKAILGALSRPTFIVKVDYTIPLRGQLARCSLESVGERISQAPIEDVGVDSASYIVSPFYFGEEIETEEAIARMEGEGYGVAGIIEFLTSIRT